MSDAAAIPLTMDDATTVLLQQVGVLAIGILIGVLVGRATQGPAQLNQTIEKEKEKVVHKLEVADIEDFCSQSGKPVCALCRCWKSKTFPYCDGSHTKHNRETGDNVGPLCIAPAAPSSAAAVKKSPSSARAGRSPARRK